MISFRTQQPLMSARAVRVIATLILLYTGADLTVPQFCSEEMGIPAVARASDVTRPTNYVAVTHRSDDSREDLPSESPSKDEDCFCCCAHVLPGDALAVVAVPQLHSDPGSHERITLPFAPVNTPYHPPRLT